MSKEEFWTTADEIHCIRRIGSSWTRHDGEIPTIDDRITRLENWLRTSDMRIWPRAVNIDECQQFARTMLEELKGAQ
jgi:hypothetical protein